MKMILILTLFFSVSAGASELLSNTVKTKLCREINNQNNILRSSECFKESSFKVMDTKKVSLNGESYTTEIDIVVKYLGTVANTELSRSISYNSEVVTLGSWEVKVTSIVLSDYHSLVGATYDEFEGNELSDSEIKKLPKKIRVWKSFAESMYNVDSAIYNYLAVLSENTGKKIGYIAYVQYESEEDNVKGYEAQNFDLTGRAVGDADGESYDYDE
ncbi:MAG: hypothetical protein HON90_03240 [Halobacteriovoraceae bacterium]|jgi:hypothetical protein|nr:hypothetical protein [Halobacteriovoraceae bacterium]